MEHQHAIETYFAQREEQLVEAVSRLVRIDSTLGPAQPGQPFGPGPAAALEELLCLAREWGLAGENLSGYIGAVDLNGQETALHILGHLDIVDPGEGWTVTQPFQPVVKGGLLYGRGSSDDKGPLVAALLAMKAVKDLGLPLRKNVRLLAGTDEETGFRDVKWYYANHPYAPHTLSPDADFPIINLEKGHYQPLFQADWQPETALPRVTAFSGGTRVNMVPSKAEATLLGIAPQQVEAAFQALDLGGAACTCQLEGPNLRVLCTGQNAHGSTPQEGINACWPCSAPCPWPTAPPPGPSGPSTPCSPTGTTTGRPWASPRPTNSPAPSPWPSLCSPCPGRAAPGGLTSAAPSPPPRPR